MTNKTTVIMQWEWNLFKVMARVKCWFTRHRYNVVKYAGWEKMEWQCSKCGGEMTWVMDIL